MSTTNPKEYLELLEVFSIALTNGLMDKADIIKWADEIIKKDSEPDYFIIELSLCGRKDINDTISILNEYIGEPKPQVSGRVILGFLYKEYIQKNVSLRKVVGSMNWLCWHSDLTENEKKYMYGVDNDYDLAESKVFGTREEVEKHALRFLEIYKNYRIDNFKEWLEVTKSIGNKIVQLDEVARLEQEEIAKTQTMKKWWKL